MLPIPKYLQHLKVWQGHPITYVTHVDPNGVPDFRIVNHQRVLECMRHKICGICGREIDKNEWICFIGGNLSVQNRCFTDPPMHRGCAIYSAKVCPYLSNQKREYATSQKDHENLIIQSIHQDRPKRMAIYHCKKYQLLQADGNVFCRPSKKPSYIDWEIMPESTSRDTTNASE